MKNGQLEQVARQLGVSKGTVSKAVNHCAGIGSELRERILHTAREQGLSGKAAIDCEAYVILPEVPAYFWREVYQALHEELSAMGIRAKYNIYSRLGDEAAVAHYLDEAEALDSRLILLAAQYPGLEARLSGMARERAIFSVCVPCGAVNTFTFAGDGWEDGRLLAQHCLRDHPHAARILLAGNHRQRIGGFAQAAAGRVLHHLPLDGGCKASQLAAAMDGVSFDVVVCVDGLTDVVCSALKKRRLEAPCYGFEAPTIEPRYGLPVGEMHQDIPAITQAAARAAHAYLCDHCLPDRKMNLFPSRYVARSGDA